MPALTVMIKPASSNCNMRCKYCFYADVSKNRDRPSMGMMSFETLDNLVRRAMSYAEGTVSFAFQGGEPTLAGIGFYEELIRLEKRYNTKGLKVMNAIQTNGYDLSDELIELFRRERFLVGVSFDGGTRLHDLLRVDAAGNGTSAHITDSIERLSKSGVEFNILCVVNAYVAEHPKEVYDALSKYGYIQYIPCIDPFEGEPADFSLSPQAYSRFLKESFDLYYRAFKQNGYVSIRNFDNYIGILLGRQPENCGMCGRCALYYLVEADGGVYPCDFYVLDRWYMGNINESSFFKLSKSPVQERFRQDSFHVSGECEKCKWYPLCRGGCRRDREPFADGLPILNKWCSCYRELFEYGYERMAEIADIIRSRD